MRGVGHRPDWAWTGLVQAYNQVARLRLSQGCRTLAAARCVVTDRLHGHILSVLLGIPHVVLDNNYGKVRSFYDTWTKGCDLVDWAESPADAAGRLATRGLAGGAFAGQRGDRSWSQQG
jgi:pyruvyl transferase EpsO